MLAFLQQLPGLKALSLTDPKSLFGVHTLTQLTILALDLERARVLDLLPLTQLPNLSALWLEGCNQPAAVSNLEELTALMWLLVRSRTLPAGLSALTGLTHLQLGAQASWARGISGIIAGLHRLAALEMHVESSAQLQPLRGLPSLTRLRLAGTFEAQLDELSHLTQLQSLLLHARPPEAMPTFPTAVASLSGLMALQLQNFGHLPDLTMPALLRLVLVWRSNSQTPYLPNLGGCLQLHTLVLEPHRGNLLLAQGSLPSFVKVYYTETAGGRLWVEASAPATALQPPDLQHQPSCYFHLADMD